jgi:hypothetical protein
VIRARSFQIFDRRDESRFQPAAFFQPAVVSPSPALTVPIPREYYSVGTISGTVGTGAAEIDATEDVGLQISPGCIPILAAVFISTNRDPAETLGIAGAGCVVPSNTINSTLVGGYSVESSAIGAIGWGTFSGTSFGATGKLVAHYHGR